MLCGQWPGPYLGPVTGRIGDFFRFWWALFYWNSRKTWFRLRGGHRDDCPCQNYSDSGLALDARCDAVIHWQKPKRFSRVCPLLTETPNGWRCGADAERVRPFWGRAALYTAGLLLSLWLIGSVALYGVLRIARYDARLVDIVWPPRWGELHRAQEKLYAARAQAALQAGNYQEAILSLEMVCQLNPRNYAAGLALAGLSQVAAQPHVAEHIYERLMHDVPEQRLQTAQVWYRALLARGAFDQIKLLATAMLEEDSAQRGAWLHALFFAANQTNDRACLGQVLQQKQRLPDWCVELLTTEQSLLSDHAGQALPRLTRVFPPPAAVYIPYYQADRLLQLGRYDDAVALLNAYGSRLPLDESTFLRLRIYEARGWTSLIDADFDNLLGYPLTPQAAARFCAFLITYPQPAAFARFYAKFVQEGPRLNGDTVALYQAVYLSASQAGDSARAEQVADRIHQLTASDSRALRGLAQLLKPGTPDRNALTRILPLVPLPTEVNYVLLGPPPKTPAK